VTADVTPGGLTQEELSERLLKGSAKKSYDPILDIDWDAPLEPDKFYLPPKLISLYGTSLWDQMTRAQRIELSRQELVNALSVGIWFENVLNQALLRDLVCKNPTARAVHYALTEVGDETRHMVMFGKAIERVGAETMSPRLCHRVIISVISMLLRGPMLLVAALIGEEIFQSLQRQMMNDPELQRVIQRVMQIHVAEEARHIRFARDDLHRRVTRMGRFNNWLLSNLNGLGGLFFGHLSTDPLIYRRARLDARDARSAAMRNPHLREVRKSAFAPLAAFLIEEGLMGPVARRCWQRSKFL
jgi:hypothetical protein